MFGFGKKKPDNVADFMNETLFESAPTDMAQTLEFFQMHAVTTTVDQREALTLLEILGGYETIIDAVNKYRTTAMPTIQYRKIIETMAKSQAAANNPSVGILAADAKGKK